MLDLNYARRLLSSTTKLFDELRKYRMKILSGDFSKKYGHNIFIPIPGDSSSR